MKVYTRNPVIFEADPLAPQNEYWIMIDGSNDNQVRHFQTFANDLGTTLKVNGKWNKDTKNAYAKHGSTWEKEYKKLFPDYTTTSPSGEKQAGKVWDHATNAWVAARDSGLLQKGLDALGINWNTQQAQPPLVTNPTAPSPEAPEVTGPASKFWPTALIVAAGSIGVFLLIKKISK